MIPTQRIWTYRESIRWWLVPIRLVVIGPLAVALAVVALLDAVLSRLIDWLDWRLG